MKTTKKSGFCNLTFFKKKLSSKKLIYIMLFITIISVLTLSLSQNVEAQTTKNLYGWNGTDWIPVKVNNDGQLSMNANVSTTSWNNLLDIPAGFSDNIDNTASLNPWSQGADTLYNDSASIKVGIGTASPTHTLNVVGESNFTQNATFEQDLKITGTLYGGSPLKIAGDINLTDGNIIASDGTIIINNDGTGNLTTSDSLMADYIYPNNNAVVTLENLTILEDIRILGNSYLGSFAIEDDLIIGSNNFSSTDVGIGTTSPSEALEVTGSVDAAEIDRLLLEKVEELTIYIVELKNENEALKQLICPQHPEAEICNLNSQIPNPPHS
jgi:hypothetical protein